MPDACWQASGAKELGSSLQRDVLRLSIMIGTLPCAVGQAAERTTFGAMSEATCKPDQGPVAGGNTGQKAEAPVGRRRASHDDQQHTLLQAFVFVPGVLQRSEQRGATQGEGNKRRKYTTRHVHDVSKFEDIEKRIRMDMIARRRVVGPGFIPSYGPVRSVAIGAATMPRIVEQMSRAGTKNQLSADHFLRP